MPRKTDSNSPADWLFIAESDVEGVRLLAEREVGYSMCRSKLAEILEKVLKSHGPAWAILAISNLTHLTYLTY